MANLDTRTLILIGAGAIVLLVGAFFLGRATAPDATAEQASATDGTSSTTSTNGLTSTVAGSAEQDPTGGDPSAALIVDANRPDPLPVYGTDEDREALLTGLAESGVGMGSRSTVLWVADSVCYDLERLIEQNRSPVFAVRVVWNETLSELDSADAAAFGAVFSAAPFYLCPETIEFSEEVAYWLGI